MNDEQKLKQAFANSKTTTTAAVLEEWLGAFRQIEAAYRVLRLVFGADPDCAVVKAMYDTHGRYTKLVAEKVGDDGGWLDWFLWENGAGENGLEAQSPGWKRARKIKTLKDLEAIITAK